MPSPSVLGEILSTSTDAHCQATMYTSGMLTSDGKRGGPAPFLLLDCHRYRTPHLNIFMNLVVSDGITSSSVQMNKALKSPKWSTTS